MSVKVRVMYQPDGIEMIGFGSMDGIAILQTDADLPREALEPLFQLGFFCSPVVIVWQVAKGRYHLAFQDNQVVNVPRIYAALVALEAGWEQDGLRLFSPPNTRATKTFLFDLLKDCCPTAHSAFF